MDMQTIATQATANKTGKAKAKPAKVELPALSGEILQEIRAIVQGAQGAEKASFTFNSAVKALSLTLNEQFNFRWYELTKADKGEQGKKVEQVRLALCTALQNEAYSNPATVWQRVKKYAKEEREPTEDAEKQPRTLDVRMVEELLKLVKACQNAEAPSEKALKTCKELIAILASAWGVHAV